MSTQWPHRIAAFVVSFGAIGCVSMLEDAAPPARADHYVKLKSTAPAMAGAETSLYVRELPAARGSSIPKAERVVLFIHGGTNPGSLVFDLQHGDYSWMQYFSNAGYDTFTMDFTGYGRSTRPKAMDDPCNLSAAQQAQFVPKLIAAPCKPSHPGPITTMHSEWEEIDAVVEHIRKLRGVEKVSIVAWSRGGPRTAGYVVRHPERVRRVFALAPDYGRDWSVEIPKSVIGAPMSVGSRKGFEDNWKGQVGCEGQADPAVVDAVWKEGLSLDPVGAGWGGVRRALPSLKYGANPQSMKSVRVPLAVAAGPFDKVVLPSVARAYYEDAASSDKVFIDVACSSHFVMWERNHLALFKASLEWIRDGKVNGMSRGETKLGY
jgi:pimeloyl-ACP methyl ester carboxylesterase